MTSDELTVIKRALAAIVPGPWHAGAFVRGHEDGDEPCLCSIDAPRWEGFAYVVTRTYRDDSPVADDPQGEEHLDWFIKSLDRIERLVAEVELQARLLADRLAIDHPDVQRLIDRARAEERVACVLAAEQAFTREVLGSPGEPVLGTASRMLQAVRGK
jgi:hypothetical protein